MVDNIYVLGQVNFCFFFFYTPRLKANELKHKIFILQKKNKKQIFSFTFLENI